MAKWSVNQTRNPAVQALLWPLAGFVLSGPKLKSLATLVNSQLIASYQVGVFNPVMLYLNYFFLSIRVECL